MHYLTFDQKPVYSLPHVPNKKIIKKTIRKPLSSHEYEVNPMGGMMCMVGTISRKG